MYTWTTCLIINGVSAFDQTLCGKAWVGMKVTNTDIFLLNVPQLVDLAVRAFTRCWDDESMSNRHKVTVV